MEYLIFQAEIKRIAREVLAVTKTFAGTGPAAAFANLFRVVSPDRVVAVTTREKNNPEETIGTGDSKEAAIADAESKVPVGANITSTELIHEAKEGTESVTAFAENNARRIAAQRIPKEATINKVDCIAPSRKGVLGFGRREGRWRASWKQPVKVAVFSDSLVHIEVQFIPEK